MNLIRGSLDLVDEIEDLLTDPPEDTEEELDEEETALEDWEPFDPWEWES